jgi:dTDP-glucose 4,6-dehydratase
LNLPNPVYGTGKNIRDWIYVLDNCEAVNLLIKKGKRGEVYNISTGNELENLEVVKRILGSMEKSEDLITFVKDRPGHDFRYSLDSSKLRKLGWRPHYSFQAALKQTIEWYTQNKWWWKPLATKKVLHPTPWELRW